MGSLVSLQRPVGVVRYLLSVVEDGTAAVVSLLQLGCMLRHLLAVR